MARLIKAIRQVTRLGILLFPSVFLCHAASRLTISPTNPRQLSHSILQFTASANREIVDEPVSWTSSSSRVATITGTSGTATASLLSAGTTTSTAAHGNLAKTAKLRTDSHYRCYRCLYGTDDEDQERLPLDYCQPVRG
jgi:hypothetical protein